MRLEPPTPPPPDDATATAPEWLLHAPDAEAAVLGSILNDPRVAPHARDFLRPEHFYIPAFRAAFAAVGRLLARSVPVDAVTLASEIRDGGEVDAGSVEGLMDALRFSVPATSADFIVHHARIVHDKAVERRIASAAALLMKNPADATLRGVVSTALADRAATVGGRRAFELMNDLEVEALRPVPDLIAGVMPTGSFVVVYGPPAAGKSLVTLDMSLCIATGRHWHDRDVRHGPVVYIAGEGTGGLRDRIAAWKESMRFGGLAGVEFVMEAVNLLDAAAVDLFLGRLIGLPVPPALVVFDTLARCMSGGDENSTQDMMRAVSSADRVRVATGATVLLVHHTNANGDRERGSTALRGAADTMMLVKPEDARSLTIVCDKQKDAAPFRRIELVIEPFGSGVTLVTPSERVELAEDLTAQQREVLESLQRIAIGLGATDTQWRDSSAGSGVVSSSYYKARKALLVKGMVEASKDGRGAQFRPTAAGQAALTPLTPHLLHSFTPPASAYSTPQRGGLESPRQWSEATSMERGEAA